jgi:hypothetical protein
MVIASLEVGSILCYAAIRMSCVQAFDVDQISSKYLCLIQGHHKRQVSLLFSVYHAQRQR